MKRIRNWIGLACIALMMMMALPARVEAHIGSPDVYFEGKAGAYPLAVTIRPPAVIPGIAEVEVRSSAAGVKGIQITPVPLTGEGATHPPTADRMQQSKDDPQFFTGSLWIMAPGSWQVRFAVDGAQGAGTLSVPLPSAASMTRPMHSGLGILLGILGIVLVLGMVGIVAAAVVEAPLKVGEKPAEAKTAWGKRAAVITLVILIAALWFGNKWWSAEASSYAGLIYKPLNMAASLTDQGTLNLKLTDPGWMASRTLDDFVPDHGKMMHLYMIRQPYMDAVYHLHPEPVGTGEFTIPLPSLATGQYKLYADVVHATGFPETLTTTLDVPTDYFSKAPSHALTGDNVEGSAPPVTMADFNAKSMNLPDGYTMTFDRPAKIVPGQLTEFRFHLLDAKGEAPTDMALYLGMQGHAAFVKDDGTVFAHTHPSGTVAMPALMMAQDENQAAIQKAGAHAAEMGSLESGDVDSVNGPSTGMKAMVAGMEMPAAAPAGGLPNVVSFPFGLPTPGQYRVFVQIKHGETVETGTFDLLAQ